MTRIQFENEERMLWIKVYVATCNTLTGTYDTRSKIALNNAEDAIHAFKTRYEHLIEKEVKKDETID